MVHDDMVGRVFNRLTVVAKDSRPWNYYITRCQCGTEKVVWKYSLTSGATQSCGCLHKEAARKTGLASKGKAVRHGLARHKLYPVWQNMMARCYSPRSDQYENYGARGVKVCERWHDVTNFIADMGDRPRGYSIDRIDNNGDYEPTNCRWASPYEQSINRRVTVTLTVDGVTKPLAEWAKDTGIEYKALAQRIKLGWSPKDIVSKPSRTRFSQTHCRHGHEFTPENTLWSQGNRHCRECRRNAGRKRKP